MFTTQPLFEPEGRPMRRPDETYAAWQARLDAWRREFTGGDAEVARTLVAPAVGMPPVSPRFAPTATGERLGDFDVTGTADLPAPQVASSASVMLSTGTASPAQAPSPSPQPWLSVGFGGSVAPGLRAPPTMEEQLAWARRRTVLEATGFDPAWGTPPEVRGLRWSPMRFLYEPSPDETGAPYREPADRGFYRQPHQSPALGPGRWGWRWIEVETNVPDPTRPYRVLGTAEASALDVDVGRAPALGHAHTGRARSSPLASLSGGAPGLKPTFKPWLYAHLPTQSETPHAFGVVTTQHIGYRLIPREDLPPNLKLEAAWTLCYGDLPPGVQRPERCTVPRSALQDLSGPDVGMPSATGALGADVESKGQSEPPPSPPSLVEWEEAPPPPPRGDAPSPVVPTAVCATAKDATSVIVAYCHGGLTDSMRLPEVAKEVASVRGKRPPGEFRANRNQKSSPRGILELIRSAQYDYKAQCGIANFVLTELRDAQKKDYICDYVVLIGHSWGADAIAQAANALRSMNVQVDCMVCLDRVGGSRYLLRKLRGNELSEHVTVGENVHAIFNVMSNPDAGDTRLVNTWGRGVQEVMGGLDHRPLVTAKEDHANVVRSVQAEKVYDEVKRILRTQRPANALLKQKIPDGYFSCVSDRAPPEFVLKRKG